MGTVLRGREARAYARISKKVLFVLPNCSEFGGLERHLIQLIDRLVGRDLQISIVCFGPDIFTEHLNPDWTSRIRVRPTTEPKTLAGWARLFWSLRPELVVFCYGWIASFPWQAPFAAMLHGIRRRIAIQHLVLPPLPPPPEGKGLRIWLRRRIGKSARLIYGWKVGGHVCTKTLCVSNAVRDQLVTTLRFPRHKTITIHNGVSTSTFVPSKTNGAAIRARLGIAPDAFLLVCAARLSAAKGIDILLQALSSVIRRGISCKCIIVGDGPLKEELLQKADSLYLRDCVSFEGFQKDVRPYLQAASAFILTSHLEGLPLAILEAMACGLPCIVTNVGGSAEAVKHRVTGLVIAPGSIEDAGNAIEYLATHPQERAEMASKARDTVSQSFDIDKQMGELVEAILG
jgi:glycosyltransferase involved in cell wall biosynthesis